MSKKLMDMLSDESDAERSIGCIKGVSQIFEKQPRQSLHQRFFSRKKNFSNNTKDEYLHVSCDDIERLHMGRQKGSPSVKKLYRTASFDSSNRRRSFLVDQGSPLHLQPHSFEFEDRIQAYFAASPLHFNSSPNRCSQKGQKAMAPSKVTLLEFDDEVIDRVLDAESRESTGYKGRHTNFPFFKETVEGTFALLDDQASGIYHDCKNPSSHTFDSKGFQKHIQESNHLVSSWLDCRERAIDDLKESLRLLDKLKDPEINNVNSKPTSQPRPDFKKASHLTQKDIVRYTIEECLQEIAHASLKVPMNTGEKTRDSSPFKQGRREENVHPADRKDLGCNSQKGKEQPKILLEGRKSVKPKIVHPENSKQTRIYGSPAIVPKKTNDFKGKTDPRSQGQRNQVGISEISATNREKNKRKPNVIARLMGLDAMPDAKHSVPPESENGPPYQQEMLHSMTTQKETPKKKKVMEKVLQQHKKMQDWQILSSEVKDEFSVDEMMEEPMCFQSAEDGKMKNKTLSKQRSTEGTTMLDEQRHMEDASNETCKRQEELFNFETPIRVCEAALQKTFQERRGSETYLENLKQLDSINPVSSTNHGLDEDVEARIRQLRLQNALEEHKNLRKILETMQLKGLLHSPLSKHMQGVRQPKPMDEVPQEKHKDEIYGLKIKNFRSLELPADNQELPTYSHPGTLHDKRNFKEAAIVLIKPILGSETSNFTVPSHDPVELQNSKSCSIVMPLESVSEQTPILESKKTGRKKITGLNSGATVTSSKIRNLSSIFDSRNGCQTAEHKNSYTQKFQDLQVQDFEQLEKEEELSPGPPRFKILASMSKEQLLGKDSNIVEEDLVDRSAENTNGGALQSLQHVGKPYHKLLGKNGSAGFKESSLHETSTHCDTVTPYNIHLPIIHQAVKILNSHDENSRLNFQLTTIPRKKEFSSESIMQTSEDSIIAEETTLSDPDSPLERRAKHTESLQNLHRARERKLFGDPQEPASGQKMGALRLFLSDLSELSNNLEDNNLRGGNGNVQAKMMEAKLYANLELPERELQKRQQFKTLETVEEATDEADNSRGELYLNGSIAKTYNTSARECSLHLYTHISQVHDQITTSEMQNERLKSLKVMRAPELKLHRERTLERHISETPNSDQDLQGFDDQEEDPVEDLPMAAARYQPSETFSTDSERPSPLSVLDIHFQEDEQIHTTKVLFASKSQESAPQSPRLHSSRRRSIEFNLQRNADKSLQEVEPLQDMTGVVYATFQTDIPHYPKGNDMKNGELQDNLSVSDSGRFKWQDDGMASIKDILQISGFTEMNAQLGAPATKESDQLQGLHKGRIHGHPKKHEIDEMGMKTLEIAERRLQFECVNEIIARKLLPFVDPHPWLSLCRPFCQKRPAGDELVQKAWKELRELPCVPIQDACDMLHILLEQDLSHTPSCWSDLKVETADVGFCVANSIFEDALQDIISDLLCRF